MMVLALIAIVAVAVWFMLPEEDWRLFTEENWKEFHNERRH